MALPDRFEHYELVKENGTAVELGRGAMGVTYKAFDVNLKCHVALKVINAAYLNEPTSAERFLREARGAAQLRHPHVASVFHLGRHDESYFYAMEFIDGETVDARLKREGPLPLKTALSIADQVTSALIAADKHKIVHRDIKPANLMLTRDGDDDVFVKLIDFGLVKFAAGAHGELTATGFLGTPYFASPEQLEQLPEDVRSDIYSLGVTLWYMLAGKPPFLGSVASVIAQHLHTPPPFDSIGHLPPNVGALLRAMLEKDRSQRIQSPSELRLQLRRCLELSPDSVIRAYSVIDSAAETLLPTAASSSGRRRGRPYVGETLEGKYRLMQDLDSRDPDQTFRGEDLVRNCPVRIKILRAAEAEIRELRNDAEKLKSAAPAGFLRVHEVLPLRAPWHGFVLLAFEWEDASPLTELLRGRGGMPFEEVVGLLQLIAPLVDQAHAAGVKPEIAASKILCRPSASTGSSPAHSLTSATIRNYELKLNPLGRVEDLESASTWVGSRTQIATGKFRTDLSELGALVIELLGPLGGENGNGSQSQIAPEKREIVQLCRNAGEQLSSAGELLEKIQRLTPLTGAAADRDVPTRSSVSTASLPQPTSPGKRLGASIGLALAAVVGVIAVWIYSRPTAIVPQKSGVAASVSRMTFAKTPPPQTGKPWTNSLNMAFAPMGEIHVCVFKVRVRDFSAFVTATNYDAEGGMYSWQNDGFKEHRHSWKTPGFPQTADDPVVGVSWEDANKFCEWLTRKERAEGTLSYNQAYRLPTDREWDRAVGLPDSPGDTPEDRSGKVKDVYPWGNRLPPSPGEFNYAGRESKVNVPESWSTIPGYIDAFPRTRPEVGLKTNAQGLCDLGGDAWEWCDDRYNPRVNWRVLRGGSWATSRPEEMLSSFRQKLDPTFRHDDVGFRCVLANLVDSRRP